MVTVFSHAVVEGWQRMTEVVLRNQRRPTGKKRHGERKNGTLRPAELGMLRALVLLVWSRGASAQCTMTALSPPPNGALSAGCINGRAMAAGETVECYSCNYGYTRMGQQPSCTGTTFAPGTPACQGIALSVWLSFCPFVCLFVTPAPPAPASRARALLPPPWAASKCSVAWILA